MAWPHKKLGDVANMVAGAIEEELGSKFSVKGLEDDFEGGLVFVITEIGKEKMFTAEFELRVRERTLNSLFYEGKPE